MNRLASRRQRPHRQRCIQVRRHGFTLLELMIVVVVVAILSVIALPSYREYVLRANRSEARAGIRQAAQWLERVATARGNYLTTAELAKFPTELKTVPSKSYAIELSGTDANGNGYTLTATPLGNQVSDKCQSFTLMQDGTIGLDSAAPSFVASAALTSECWGR
jgi:type IV pilus assembly protein PilE